MSSERIGKKKFRSQGQNDLNHESRRREMGEYDRKTAGSKCPPNKKTETKECVG